MNVDHGALPAANDDVMAKLHLDNFNAGVLGGTVYLGILVGSLATSHFFVPGNRVKNMLVVALAINAVAICGFGLADNYILALLFRLISGFCQVFMTIFVPVWADAFAPQKTKSIWISILLLMSPVGLFFAMILTPVFQERMTWEWAFYFQAIATIPLIVGLVFTSDECLDTFGAA
jgi:sugar phosphate permease